MTYIVKKIIIIFQSETLIIKYIIVTDILN